MHSLPKAALAALFSFGLLATGCGSDDDSAEGDTVDAAQEGAGDGSAQDGAGEGSDQESEDSIDPSGAGEGDAAEGTIPEECPAVATFEGTIERVSDEEAGHREVSMDGSEMTDVIASESMGLYSVYLADHEVDRTVLDGVLEGSISTESYAEAPDGSVLVTIGLGDMYAEAPTAAGDVFSTEASSMTVQVDSGGGMGVLGMEDVGRAEVLGLDSEAICFSIEYQDESLSVNGIVHAPVYDGTN